MFQRRQDDWTTGAAALRRAGVATGAWYLLLLPLLWLGSGRSLALDPGALAVPGHLGQITERVGDGQSRPAVVVIGESHVNLDVQRSVAELIGYLRTFYGIKLLLVEGHEGPLADAPGDGLPLRLRRAVARAELDGRNIGAVEYVAMSYPDVKILGIEDKVAYRAHDVAMGGQKEKVGERAKALDSEFNDFLVNDLGSRSASSDQIASLQSALEGFLNGGQMEPLAEIVYAIVGRSSPSGRRMQGIVKELAEIRALASQPATDTDEFKQRDDGMARNVQRALQGQDAALVVGSMHLPGLAKRLRDAGIPFAVIEVAGLQESIRGAGKDDAEVYEEWKAGKGGGLEQLLSRFKPEPSLQRESYLNAVAVKNALFAIDRGVAEGSSLAAMRGALESMLAPDIRIAEVTGIPGGTRFRLIRGNQVIDAYFGPTPAAVRKPGAEPEETGKAPGGRHFAFYKVPDTGHSGGGGRLPPSGPPGGGPSGPSVPGGPGGTTPGEPPGSGSGAARIVPIPDDMSRSRQEHLQDVLGEQDTERYIRLLDTRDRQNSDTATLFLVERDGTLYWLANQTVRVVDADPKDLADLARRLPDAKALPEQLDLSRQLGERLLEGIDELIPDGARKIVLSIQPEQLRGLSLTEVAGYGRIATTQRFAALPEEVMPYDGLADGSAERALSWVEPPVESAHIAVLVDDRMRGLPGYDALLGSLRNSGIRLNEMDAGTRAVIVVGAGETEGLRITLSNRQAFDPRSEAGQRLLAEVDQVLAIGIDLPALRTDEHWSKQESVADAADALAKAKEDVDDIRSATGEHSGKRLSEVQAKQAIRARQRIGAVLDARTLSGPRARKIQGDTHAAFVSVAGIE